MKINLLDIPVYYINLDKATDQRAYLTSKLEELGFTNVNRIDAIKDKAGIIGLSKSQHLALSQVKAPFIVLEDDCDPVSFVSEIEVPDDADAVYLGNSPWGRVDGHHGLMLRAKRIPEYDGVYRIFNMLSSHAILYLTDSYVEMCQRTTKYCAEVSAVPMDVPFAEIQKYFNIYAFNKPHFKQKSYSGAMSNAPRWTDSTIDSHKVRRSLQRNLFQDPFFATRNMIE